jgi:NADH-dependent peroxiredoxin subunit F
MLDAATKAQLKSYLERATQPIEIVASLDDSQASGELLSLLKDVAEASPLVKLTESRDDNHRKPSFSVNRRAKTTARALPACRWAMNSPR